MIILLFTCNKPFSDRAAAQAEFEHRGAAVGRRARLLTDAA
jgi:hypothetical protein